MTDIKNWNVVASDDQVRITGKVYGDSRFKNGSIISTSPVIGWTPNNDIDDPRLIIKTQSGSEYVLTNPEPFAVSKLLKHLYSLEPYGDDVTATTIKAKWTS